MVDINLYKIFYTVATTGNISKASEILFTGQPSVSKSIKKLESELKVNLFTRNSRGVRLTEEGKILFEHIASAMDTINTGELAIKKVVDKDSGQIKIGISATLYKYFLLPYIKQFLTEFKNFSVEIIDNSTSYITLDLITEEKVDIGIVSKPFTLQDVEFVSIGLIEEIFIAEKNFICAYDNFDNLQDFFNQNTFIFLEKGNITRDYNERFLKQIGITVKPDIVTSNMDFIIDLVKVGVGFGIVFKEVVKEDLESKKLIELDFIQPIPKREIGIVCKKNKQKSIALQEFINYYKNIYDYRHNIR
ncbi:MAG: LysR family transcriptional regulator [Clostridiales bacterium]|jgi:DNA-binding transcriptional LysR family regulator|nr:LysR family transcriptional regulator [Clostridiales bacterium]